MLSSEGPGSVTNQTDPVHAQTDEYGPSDFDSRNRFNASGLWNLPIFPHSKGVMNAIFGGWQLGGVLTAYSGFPWTPVTGFQNSVAPVTSAATINPTRPVQYYNNANQSDRSNDCFINGCTFGGTSQTSTIVAPTTSTSLTRALPESAETRFVGPASLQRTRASPRSLRYRSSTRWRARNPRLRVQCFQSAEPDSISVRRARCACRERQLWTAQWRIGGTFHRIAGAIYLLGEGGAVNPPVERPCRSLVGSLVTA